MELIYHPEAYTDLQHAAEYYEAVSPKVLAHFWQEFDAAISALQNFPERNHFDPSGYRRRNLRRFPYHILYEIQLNDILVLTIRHDRQHPEFGIGR